MRACTLFWALSDVEGLKPAAACIVGTEPCIAIVAVLTVLLRCSAGQLHSTTLRRP